MLTYSFNIALDCQANGDFRDSFCGNKKEVNVFKQTPNSNTAQFGEFLGS